MTKVICIPDSFKGTLSSGEICERLEAGIGRRFPDWECVSIPVADGGEGSVDAFLSYLGGEKIFLEATGPFFEKMEAFYGLLPDGTAVIEMAAVAGLPLVEGRKNPEKATTYGVGELLLHAVRKGSKKIILGLGGSATNDGGCGCAYATGIRFFNENGESFIPVGGTLKDIRRIDKKEMDPALEGVEIITMCDIDNPMYGEQGAAHIFAPQKGADEDMVKSLDEGVKNLAGVFRKDFGLSLDDVPGSGASGAMGAGMMAFFGSRLQMGIEVVLETLRFRDVLEDADLVITGEGKLDGQSLRGKVVVGVGRVCKEKGVPVIAIVGGSETDISEVYDQGIDAVFTTNTLPLPFEKVRHLAGENLDFTIDNILRLISLSGRVQR